MPAFPGAHTICLPNASTHSHPCRCEPPPHLYKIAKVHNSEPYPSIQDSTAEQRPAALTVCLPISPTSATALSGLPHTRRSDSGRGAEPLLAPGAPTRKANQPRRLPLYVVHMVR